VGSEMCIRDRGNGTFQAAGAYGSGGCTADWVAVADVNGDGKPDLLVANLGEFGCTSGNGVGVLLAKATTHVAPGLSMNPSTYGQSVTFTATVTPSSGGGVPTGTVTLKSGATKLATVTMSGGVANYTTATLTAGTKSITAIYNGDSTHATSTSTALSQVINNATTTTALSSSPNPSTFGQSVTFTATVSPQYSGTPTGSVTFKLGTTKLATVTMSGGAASFSTSTLPRGSDKITATYNGSGSFTNSSGSIVQTVK